MNKKEPIQLNERIHLIDGYDLGVTERTGTYVISEEELTIVESGPSPSVKHVKGEGNTLKIGSACTLEFLDTPGHAKHHFSIYDPISNGLFTGDTVGIRYPQLIRDGVQLFLPSTSPNQFDPEAMQKAIERMLEMNLDAIYYGHYGMTNEPNHALLQVAEWLSVFMEEAQAVVAEEGEHVLLAKRLSHRVREYLKEQGVADNHKEWGIIDLDMEVSAMGIIDYFSKKIFHTNEN